MELLLNAFVDFSVEGDGNDVVDSIQWCLNGSSSLAFQFVIVVIVI